MRGLYRYKSDLIGYKSQADKGNVKLLQGSLTWPSAKTRLRLNFQGRATLTTPAPIAYCSFNTSSSGVNPIYWTYRTVELCESSVYCSYCLQSHDSLCSRVCPHYHGLITSNQAAMAAGLKTIIALSFVGIF